MTPWSLRSKESAPSFARKRCRWRRISSIALSGTLPRLEEKRKQVKALGLWAPHLPKEMGGPGLTLPEFARISEELGRTPLGHYLFNCQAPDIGNMEILMAYGTAEQKATWLAPLVRGEVRSCFSMTEPEYAGSNPVWMATTARKDGDDYVIDGHKWFTSAADGAAFAIVMAITNPDAESPHLRASQIIVPTNTPGFHLRAQHLDRWVEAGEGYLSHAEIVYKNCRVPRSNLLGQEGKGFEIAQQRLGPGRIHHCMRWIGICERAFEMMCHYAATRLLAPGKPAGQPPDRSGMDCREPGRNQRLPPAGDASRREDRTRRQPRRPRGDFHHQVLRRQCAATSVWTAPSRPTAPWASRTTWCCPIGIGTSAPRASTTAPMKCINPSSPGFT